MHQLYSSRHSNTAEFRRTFGTTLSSMLPQGNYAVVIGDGRGKAVWVSDPIRCQARESTLSFRYALGGLLGFSSNNEIFSSWSSANTRNQLCALSLQTPPEELACFPVNVRQAGDRAVIKIPGELKRFRYNVSSFANRNYFLVSQSLPPIGTMESEEQLPSTTSSI